MAWPAELTGDGESEPIILAVVNKFDNEHIVGRLRRILGRLRFLACMAPPHLSEATRNDPAEFFH